MHKTRHFMWKTSIFMRRGPSPVGKGLGPPYIPPLALPSLLNPSVHPSPPLLRSIPARFMPLFTGRLRFFLRPLMAQWRTSVGWYDMVARRVPVTRRSGPTDVCDGQASVTVIISLVSCLHCTDDTVIWLRSARELAAQCVADLTPAHTRTHTHTRLKTWLHLRHDLLSVSQTWHLLTRAHTRLKTWLHLQHDFLSVSHT